MQVANANPHITVTGRHLPITAAINDYAKKRIEGLHLDYPKIIEAHVIVEVEKYRHRAEVVLVCCNHITIEATEESSDLYASIDQVVAKIGRQMRKYKTRLLRSHRPRRSDVVRFLEERVIAPEAFEIAEAQFDASRNGHREAPPAAAEPPPAPVASVASTAAVQTEKFPVKPMFIDEAILQMEMGSRDFLVFLNAETDKVNVLYRRKRGDFGLIDPVVP